MERTFRAEKMIARIKREGKQNMLDKETLNFIKLLDGKKGNDYNYRSFVYDEPLVWIEADSDQEGTYVALCDCD